MNKQLDYTIFLDILKQKRKEREIKAKVGERKMRLVQLGVFKQPYKLLELFLKFLFWSLLNFF